MSDRGKFFDRLVEQLGPGFNLETAEQLSDEMHRAEGVDESTLEWTITEAEDRMWARLTSKILQARHA